MDIKKDFVQFMKYFDFLPFVTFKHKLHKIFFNIHNSRLLSLFLISIPCIQRVLQLELNIFINQKVSRPNPIFLLELNHKNIIRVDICIFNLHLLFLCPHYSSHLICLFSSKPDIILLCIRNREPFHRLIPPLLQYIFH